MGIIKRTLQDIFLVFALLWLATMPAHATISGTTLKSGPYTCNGSTASFSVGFAYIEDSDLVVQTLTTSTGSIATLAITSNYTVTDGTPLPDGTFPNGTIVLNTPSSSCVTGQTLTISRALGLTQGQAYPEGGLFPSSATEQAFDRLTLFSQQQQLSLNNSIQIPTVDNGITTVLPVASQRANTFLAFDGSGNITTSALGGYTGSTQVTTLGTITTGTWNATPVTVPYGGTGDTTLTAHGVLLGEGTGSVVVTAAGTSNYLLTSNGASSDPTYQQLNLGTSAAITGTLPVGNGGTGVTALSSITTLSGLTSVGTIGTGTWQGTVVGPTYGGTGVTALSSITTLSGLTSVGTIGTGTWQGTVVGPTYGGTGVNNGSYTMTLGGNVSTAGALTTSGAYPLTLTTAGSTNVTLPTSGTLVNTGVSSLSSLTTVGALASGSLTTGFTTVAAAQGGTGQTSIANAFISFYESVATTLGDMVYGGASGTPTRLAGNTASTIKFLSETGSGGNAQAPVWDTLTAAQLPTGTVVTNTGSPAQGDVLYWNGSSWTDLAPGTSGFYLQTQGAGANPIWHSVSGSGTVTSVATTAPITGGTFTTTGTIACATCVASASTWTQGDVLYYNGSNWVDLAAGTSGQFLQTKGASANPVWAVSGNLPITFQTSTYAPAASDNASQISFKGASGAATWTLTSASTLGSGWYAVLNNPTTFNLTLKSSGGTIDTIAAATGFIMYPGEVRLVQTDGTNFYTTILHGGVATFTASTTWERPPGYNKFFVEVVAGGGSGAVRTTTGNAAGGGGGGTFTQTLSATAFVAVGSTETITVAASAASVVSGNTNGNTGNHSAITINGVSWTTSGSTAATSAASGSAATGGAGDSLMTSATGLTWGWYSDNDIYEGSVGGSVTTGNVPSTGNGGLNAGGGGASSSTSGGVRTGGIPLNSIGVGGVGSSTTGTGTTGGTAPGGGGGGAVEGANSGSGAGGQVTITGIQ